jgi:hypothetical protein
MFGFEAMIKAMLEDAGINIEQLQAESMQALHDAKFFAARMVQTQSEIVGLMKVNYAMQKYNSDKLDAIMSHLGIELSTSTVIETENNHAIELKPN